jgi:hypothetical protein
MFRRGANETCPLFFWDFTLLITVVSYRRFGTIYGSHLQRSSSPRRILLGPLKMGPTICPETSVRNYHSDLRQTQKEHRSHNNYCFFVNICFCLYDMECELSVDQLYFARRLKNRSFIMRVLISVFFRECDRIKA